MGRKRRLPLEAVCHGCGITFPLKAGDRLKKYCTVECFWKHGSTAPRPQRRGEKRRPKTFSSKECKQCRNSYVPTGESQKFCSLECNKQWNLANINLTERRCSLCKEIKPIEQFSWVKSKGIRRSDCKACVNADGKRRNAKHREEHPEMYSNRRRYDGYKERPRTCEWCFAEFYPTRIDQRFCNKKCSAPASLDRSATICKECGKDFIKTGNAHEFCSPDCTKSWNLKLDVSGQQKTCKGCEILQPISAYAQNPKTGYYQSSCNTCMNKARDARAAKNPKKYKRSSLKTQMKKFGITVEHFDILLQKQAGKCWICGEDEPRYTRLSVDHCHSEGYVRGLLCTRCNQGLGHFRDREDLLTRAALYLELHRELNNLILKGEPLPCPQN